MLFNGITSFEFYYTPKAQIIKLKGKKVVL
nr:MAG TPA: hypothetical protein [Caudoviricetes sp.]